MNRLLFFYFFLLGWQISHAQQESMPKILGHWYIEQRFAATDQDQDDLLSLKELNTYQDEWIYYLQEKNFEQVDQNRDQHLNLREMLDHLSQEFSYRLEVEQAQLDLWNQKYKYFYAAKAKYLKRHPYLTQALMSNYLWTDGHHKLVQKLLNDRAWLKEHPKVQRSLATNFRWLTKHSSLATKLYARKAIREYLPELSSWRLEHLKLIKQYPILKKEWIPIKIPYSPTQAIRNAKEEKQPANKQVTVDKKTSKQWLEQIDQDRLKIDQKLAEIRQGPNPLKRLRDSVSIVVSFQKKEIDKLYDKLYQQTKHLTRLHRLDVDSLAQIQWDLKSELDQKKIQLDGLKRERIGLANQVQGLKKQQRLKQQQISYLQTKNDSLQHAQAQMKLSQKLKIAEEQLLSVQNENQLLKTEIQQLKKLRITHSQALSTKQIQQRRLVLENESMREQLSASQAYIRESMAEKSRLEAELRKHKLTIAQLSSSKDSLIRIASSLHQNEPPGRDSIGMHNFQAEIVELEQRMGLQLRENLKYAQQIESLQEDLNRLKREKLSLATNKQINELRFRQLEAREHELKRQATKNSEREKLLTQRETILKQNISAIESKERKYQQLLEKEKELKLLEQRLKQQNKKNK